MGLVGPMGCRADDKADQPSGNDLARGTEPVAETSRVEWGMPRRH